jgi:hypothetical protein
MIAAAFTQKVFGGGGKSELRRAVCRITSGTEASRPLDGKCNRERTAPNLVIYFGKSASGPG